MTKEQFQKQFLKDQTSRKNKSQLEAKLFRDSVFDRMYKTQNKGKRQGQI